MSDNAKLIAGLHAAWAREIAGAKTYRALAQSGTPNALRNVEATEDSDKDAYAQLLTSATEEAASRRRLRPRFRWGAARTSR